MGTNFYEVLGVGRTADADELKRAYRKIILACHPDRNPGDEAAAKRARSVVEAYDTLGDPAARARYDHPTEPRGRLFPPSNVSDDDPDLGIDELLGAFFSRGGANFFTKPWLNRKGPDLEMTLKLTLEEVVTGTYRGIDVARVVICKTCNAEECKHCGGTKNVTHRQGHLTMRVRCTSCKNDCRSCLGKGVMAVTTSLSVRVPSGVEEGQRLRVKGKGNTSKNGEGDLLLTVTRLRHTTFRPAGLNLFTNLQLTEDEALNGATKSVRTLRGMKELIFTPVTDKDDVFVLDGEGLPGKDGRVGDLFLFPVVA